MRYEQVEYIKIEEVFPYAENPRNNTAEAIMRYQREGKNLHDDAPDCITGVYENPKPLGGWMY